MKSLSIKLEDDWAITRQVKELFDNQGVSIPFLQCDVHIHQISNNS